MALFELGLTTIGKNFFKIHHTHLPGKEIKEIVLFYYKVLHSLFILRSLELNSIFTICLVEEDKKSG